MSIRLILFCFLVVALCPARAVSEEDRTLTHGWEYEVMNLSTLCTLSSVFSDSIRCGDYFIFFEEENHRYIYCLPEARDMANDTLVMTDFRYEKCKVYLNNKKYVPTIQPFYSKGGKVDSVLIRISEKEYAKAFCLPEPQKKKKNIKPSKDTTSENKKAYCYAD